MQRYYFFRGLPCPRTAASRVKTCVLLVEDYQLIGIKNETRMANLRLTFENSLCEQLDDFLFFFCSRRYLLFEMCNNDIICIAKRKIRKVSLSEH